MVLRGTMYQKVSTWGRGCDIGGFGSGRAVICNIKDDPCTTFHSLTRSVFLDNSRVRGIVVHVIYLFSLVPIMAIYTLLVGTSATIMAE